MSAYRVNVVVGESEERERRHLADQCIRTLEGFSVTVDPIGHRLVAQATLACGAARQRQSTERGR